MMAPNRTMVYSPRAYHNILEALMYYGDEIAPRGIKTRELINATLLLRNPTDRIVTDRGRRMNVAFGIAEWVAIMTGITDIGFFKHFIADYGRFSSDGKTLDGAYGGRTVFDRNGSRYHQIIEAIDILRKDPSSRRAVVAIYRDGDLFGGGLTNTPCTLTLQFMVRGGRLRCIVNMRSCDVVKGLTYDAFCFTMVQEYVARQLNVPLGEYTHNAGSLHIYGDDYGLAGKLTRKRWPHIMNEMPLLESHHLSVLRSMGEALTETEEFFDDIDSFPNDPQYSYVSDMLCTLQAYRTRKSDPHSSKRAFGAIRDITLKYVLRPWLVSSGVLPSYEPKVRV